MNLGLNTRPPQDNTSTDTLKYPFSKPFPGVDACHLSKCKQERPRRTMSCILLLSGFPSLSWSRCPSVCSAKLGMPTPRARQGPTCTDPAGPEPAEDQLPSGAAFENEKGPACGLSFRRARSNRNRLHLCGRPCAAAQGRCPFRGGSFRKCGPSCSWLGWWEEGRTLCSQERMLIRCHSYLLGTMA